jgi:hypothetical protein
MWCENTLFQNELTAYLHMSTHHCLKNQNVKLRLSIIGLKHGPSKVYGLSQCISYNWGQGLNANDDHNHAHTTIHKCNKIDHAPHDGHTLLLE